MGSQYIFLKVGQSPIFATAIFVTSHGKEVAVADNPM